MALLEPMNFRQDTIMASLSLVPWKSVATRAVTNLRSRKEETTRFMFFFTTAGNGKSVLANPIVNAKATRAKAFESVSTYLPKQQGKGKSLSLLDNFACRARIGGTLGCPREPLISHFQTFFRK